MSVKVQRIIVVMIKRSYRNNAIMGGLLSQWPREASWCYEEALTTSFITDTDFLCFYVIFNFSNSETYKMSSFVQYLKCETQKT